ncbi:MAG: hypothetical protein IJD58_05710 [Lachnospiraceae bacterium]|nr:hypothetical protein [Lachnospiraceae bacterium]
MQQTKHISRYIKNVKKIFPWGYPKKKKILKELKNNLKTFFNDHPDISYDDLCLHFGTPDSYIDDRMSLYSPNELRRSVQMKKRKYIILGVIIFIIIMAFICGVIFIKHNIEKHSAATITEGFIVGGEIITDEKIIIHDEHIIDDKKIDE